ncbi:MAG: phosphate acyltransferase PlsX [Clostridiales bacterium]|uniref:Phosphate acyltransferase n=1 Tax=Candidatus Anaerobutyricum stercoripullorum TaxID=2838456 RepID=A0A9D1X4V7_9FIRM|nr:phosphate acyltransferase PlsX [Clostridiales bacterium]HIX72645.1 phosphate acyltransferase PlsX [Candidatus Anaerobutyricum stercoripullorum]
MDYSTVIALDAMGGDNAPGEIVKGAVDAVNERNDIRIQLYGDKDSVEAELQKYTYHAEQIAVIHTTEEISCDESPAAAIKKKKDSSLVRALRAVKDGECDAVISAGSSGAVLVGGQVIVGKCKGVKRAPLAPVMPTEKGISLLIDCGANVDARPEHLVQFAQMGSIYMEHVMGIPNPKVAIVNIGAEEAKGNALVKETYPLLKECKGINFVGSIEARDIPKGDVDVIVTEAFVGNVILKLEEGLAKTMMTIVKRGMMSSLMGKIGGLLAKPSLKRTLKTFDASEHGGAPLLGLKGLVVKIHGSSTAKETRNAIMQCVSFKEARINERIMEYLAPAQDAGQIAE